MGVSFFYSYVTIKLFGGSMKLLINVFLAVVTIGFIRGLDTWD